MTQRLPNHQGNLTATIHGNAVERLGYDAWGRRRNPVGFGYGTVAEPVEATFDRGYTLHEHYDDFDLINMNGRLYDPVLGRMLSPDIAIQDEYNAQAYFNQVSLAWRGLPEAVNYVICRDGEVLAMQSETAFKQFVDLGTCVYSVVAVNGEHQKPMPAFAEIEITDVGLNEAAAGMRVFPNPVSDVLHIDIGQRINYVFFNSMGRQVLQGESDGKAQICCSNLSKGLYLLQIATPSQVIVNKVVVK